MMVLDLVTSQIEVSPTNITRQKIYHLSTTLLDIYYFSSDG